MLIDGQFPVAAPPEVLMRHLFDARLMASCLPGCESLTPLDPEPCDRYQAVVVVALAGIKARFDLQVQVTQRDALNVWATTRGEEGGQASTLQADSQVSLAATPEGTLVSYRSDVSVTGRLGRFALGMMKKKAQSLGDEFAANLQRALTALEVPAAAAAPAAAPASPAASADLIPNMGVPGIDHSAPAAAQPGTASMATGTPSLATGLGTAAAAAAAAKPALPALPALPMRAPLPVSVGFWSGLWSWLRGLLGATPKAGS